MFKYISIETEECGNFLTIFQLFQNIYYRRLFTEVRAIRSAAKPAKSLRSTGSGLRALYYTCFLEYNFSCY